MKSFNEFTRQMNGSLKSPINESNSDVINESESKEELLIEHITGSIGVVLSESVSDGKHIEGVFAQANLRNRNGRTYPRAVLEKAVEEYERYHRENGIAMLGELNHPPRAEVDPMEAAIVIEKLWWEGDNLMGRARIIENDGGNGDALMKLIKKGKWVPGVSTRGLGRVKNGIVQEGYRITAIVDVVASPSAIDAFVNLV